MSSHKFINVITPCLPTRFNNLLRIYDSIRMQIPKDQYRWIIVVDTDTVEVPEEIMREIRRGSVEVYLHKDLESRCGNGQRNFGLEKVTQGYVYFMDDDHAMHPQFYETICDADPFDFLLFCQNNPDGSPRISTTVVAPCFVDTNQFVCRWEVIGDTRWDLKRPDADGLFAQQVRAKSSEVIFFPFCLSVYNNLRKYMSDDT